jgi:hypothetical protein
VKAYHDEAPAVFKPMVGAEIGKVAAELHASGHGSECGECGKQFTAARKPRAVARVSYLEPNGDYALTTSWLLCGRCRAAMKLGHSPEIEKQARAAAASWLICAPLTGWQS